MPTTEKATVIEATKERYQKSAGLVFTEYRGLGVKDLQALRADLRAKGGDLSVVKNTLFRIAAGEGADALPIEFTSGPTAIAFVYENETDCAKVLVEYGRKNRKFIVKGGYFGGKVYDGKAVAELSDLPSREVLLAQVVGAVAAPLSGLVGVIEALYSGPIRAIGAVADKAAGESSSEASA